MDAKSTTIEDITNRLNLFSGYDVSIDINNIEIVCSRTEYFFKEYAVRFTVKQLGEDTIKEITKLFKGKAVLTFKELCARHNRLNLEFHLIINK